MPGIWRNDKIPGGIWANSSIICHLAKTGQETSYHDYDDGYYEFGVGHNYEVLTTGQYAGTSNIVINGKTHALSNNCVKNHAIRRNGKPIEWARYIPLGDIGPAADGKLFWSQWTLVAESCTFDSGAKTITAAAGTPFVASTLGVGRKITITGTVNNNKVVTVTNITTSVITVSENLTNEGPVDTTFATKDDLIWDLREQARTNNLGGYDDWEIPNFTELSTLVDFSTHNPAIDTTIFPSTPSSTHWSSSANPHTTADRLCIDFINGTSGSYQTTADLYKKYCRLVRS